MDDTVSDIDRIKWVLGSFASESEEDIPLE
jgi:hypothetical protein